MRYVLQKQKNKQHCTQANNFFRTRAKNYSSINQKSLYVTRCTAATILSRLHDGVCCQMGSTCACEVYETSWNLPFPVFLGTPKYSIPGLHKFQLPRVWKNRVAAGRVETTLENALIQAPKFGLSIRTTFWKIAFFWKIWKRTRLN